MSSGTEAISLKGGNINIYRERERERDRLRTSRLCNMCLCVWHRRAVFQRFPPTSSLFSCSALSGVCNSNYSRIWCQVYNYWIMGHDFIPSSSSSQLLFAWVFWHLLPNFCPSSEKTLLLSPRHPRPSVTLFFFSSHGYLLKTPAWAVISESGPESIFIQVAHETICHFSTCWAPSTNSVHVWCTLKFLFLPSCVLQFIHLVSVSVC